MRLKTAWILLACFLCSVGVMTTLYLLSDNIIHKHNSFLRIYPHHPAKEANVLNVKYNSYYIAGTTKNKIYFGNVTAPFHMLVTSRTLTDSQHVHLSLDNFDVRKLKRLQLKIDSPYFYMVDGVMPGIFRGRLGEWRASRFMYDSAYFTQLVLINKSSFALRSVSSQTQENILGKETTDTPHVKFVSGLLEKQIDGIFCTDGMLQYSKQLGKLVYTYFYRNQYIVMDSNLNLLYRGQTIDTISKAKIKIAKISSKNSSTMSAPPLKVNKKSYVFGNWLFVNSGLMAKNDDEIFFEQAAIIDVYDLSNRSYEFSFPVYNHENRSLREFWVDDNLLVAMIDHFVVTYDLEPHYFKLTESIAHLK